MKKLPSHIKVHRPIEVRLPDFGVCVIESHHDRDFESPVLRHPFSKFIVPVAGHGNIETPKGPHPLSPREIIHVPAGISHRIKDDPRQPLSLYVVCYHPRIPPTLGCKPLAGQALLRLGSSSTEHYLTGIFHDGIREMLFEQEFHREGWETLLLSRLGQLLVCAHRNLPNRKDSPAPLPGGESQDRVTIYVQRMESHFYQNETLDQAAASTGLGRRRFTQLFHQVTGKTWRRRVEELRLKHACKLLQETDRTITGVAFECGFEDLSHFHHVFKKSQGCTPMAFRKRRS